MVNNDILNTVKPAYVKLCLNQTLNKLGTPYEEVISLIFTENEPDKTRKLASAVNDQLHEIT
jgi:hypothetical protein